MAETDAVLQAVYPKPELLRLRTSGTAWSDPVMPSEVLADRAIFRVKVPRGQTIEAKIVRDDGAWMRGRNFGLHRGEHFVIAPWFDRDGGQLGEMRTIGSLRARVLLPPAYEEHSNRRFPVVYAFDGQALFSDSKDPFGIWNLDVALDALWTLRAIRQCIVVAIDNSKDRVDQLSPVRDPKHGGGKGAAFLSKLVDELVPAIDSELRTERARQGRTLLGSSMGGLFAFYAAWTRPDTFGACAALSSSFWWADRWAIRLAQEDACPAPRPRMYLDSGASLSEVGDANAQDGYLHTQAMIRVLTGHCYELGNDLSSFAFPGATHDAGSWSARIALPLQVLLPPR
ncbi:MAG: alpha/beta hydrolase [Polyangiales bacterium]